MSLSEKEQEARQKVCLPLDGLHTFQEVRQRVEELSPIAGLFKVGKELYTRFGPEVVKLVQSYHADVFLDLKYHDIPNTVKGAAHAATLLGVRMFNVHASGGLAMMQAAVEGANKASKKHRVPLPSIIGVTVLTSIDQRIMNDELGVTGTVEHQVVRLAKLAQQAGLNGIVCSAADLKALKGTCPPHFLFVTPGIKGPKTAAGTDQKRVFTPGNALRDGASLLVIGRAITGQPTREARLNAGRDILQDMVKHGL